MRLQMILQVHLCPCDLFCDKIKGVLPKEEKGRWIWEKGGKPVVASGLCPRLPPVLSTESGPGSHSVLSAFLTLCFSSVNSNPKTVLVSVGSK